MTLDPVCGMEVEEGKEAAASVFRGKRYLFCSPGCKEKFDRNPEAYIRKEPVGDKERIRNASTFPSWG